MTYLHYTVRPKRLTADFLREEYQSLEARVHAAESAANESRWLELLLDWNALKAYVHGDEARISDRVDVSEPDARAREDEEYWKREIAPIVDALDGSILEPMLASRHRPALETRHGAHLFQRLDARRGALGADMFELQRRENDALHAFASVLNGLRPTLSGIVTTRAELETMSRSPDAATRRRSFEAGHVALAAVYGELAGHLDTIVRARHSQALALGHRSFVPVGYARMGRTGFGPDDVACLRDAVERHLTPLAIRHGRRRAADLGLSRLHAADIAYDPASTLPRGIAAPAESLLDRAGLLFDDLSPRLGRHFRTLREWDLVRYRTSDGRATRGYCTAYPDEGRVGITVDGTTDANDVVVLLHEAGHAFQKLESSSMELVELRMPSGDLAEVHSTTMEYLGARHVERMIPSAHAASFRRQLWLRPLWSICAIARIDAFFHWIYEHPEASPSDRERMLVELEDRFSGPVDWSGFEHLRRVGPYVLAQFYFVPFRMTDYAISRLVAMQVALVDATDHERAMEIYLELCALGGSVGLLEALERVGLESPFEEETIAGIAAHIRSMLDETDEVVA
jgi:M3 family oligoendopeptidase